MDALQVLKYNLFHDESGRFTTADNAHSSVENASAKAKSMDALMRRLTPEQRQKLVEMQDAVNNGTSSKSEHYDKERGAYKPERQALHDEIVNKWAKKLADFVPTDGSPPNIVILGGRGGSGKSNFTTNGKGVQNIQEFDDKKHLTLDPDEIKKEFSDVGYNGKNAALYHEEAGDVYNRIVAKAREMGANVTMDVTLKTIGRDDPKDPSIDFVLKSFIEKGYTAEGHYMYLPRHKAAERALDRALNPENGRFVPASLVMGNYQNEANFNSLKKHFTKWSIYNNDVPKGEKPKLMSRSKPKAKE